MYRRSDLTNMRFGCISQLPEGKPLKDGYYEVDKSRLFISDKGQLMLFISDDWYNYFFNGSVHPESLGCVDEEELIRVLCGGV